MKIITPKSNDVKTNGIKYAIGSWNWDQDVINIFDMIQEVKPDVILLPRSYVLQNFQTTKSIWYAMEEFHPQGIKFILLQDSNISLLEKEILSSEIAQDFDLIIDLNDFHYALDQRFTNGTRCSKFECDISVFTQNLTDQHIEWINRLGDNHRIKIFGPQKIDSVYYLGSLLSTEYKDVLASSTKHVMFSLEWFYPAVVNNAQPLYFVRKPDNKIFSFSSYDELNTQCLSGAAITNISIPTYKDIADNIRKQLCNI
jgi:hypothetical protein